MERNRFYRGPRLHHVDRITIELDADASAVERVENGELDSVAPTPDLNPQLAALVDRYGINRSRVFVLPDLGTRTCAREIPSGVRYAKGSCRRRWPPRSTQNRRRGCPGGCQWRRSR